MAAEAAALAMPDEGPLTPEQAIAKNVHQFEIVALLDLLESLGYSDDQIELQSHLSVTPSPGLVEKIEFFEEPRRVLLSVNLGMLSVHSPLPSYLMKLMAEPPEFHFIHFMRFIDHPLLKARFAAITPERSSGFRTEWLKLRQKRVELLNLRSPSTIGWLFRQHFPELEVTVRRMSDTQPLPSAGVKLGSAVLGQGTAFGGKATVTTNGIEVRLAGDELLSGNGLRWGDEARRRISSRILPLFADSDLPLIVTLVLRDQESWLRLERGNLLGYEPLGYVEGHAREIRLLQKPDAA